MTSIGIDVGKAELVVYALPERVQKVFENNQAGFVSLLVWAKRCKADSSALQFTMETTGVYWEAVACFLREQQQRVNVLNPAQIHSYGKSRLKRAKTDALDAKLIAEFADRHPCPAWEPPLAVVQHLRLFCREREELVAESTRIRNRQHANACRGSQPALIQAQLEERLTLMQTQLDNLEKEIKRLIAGSAELKQQDKLLQSIPGVGPVMSWTLLGETFGLSTVHSGKQLAAYAGVTPCPFESGSSVKRKAHISKMGNAHLRAATYMAGMAAFRSHSCLGKYGQRLASRVGKKGAFIAVGHKILRIAFAVVRAGVAYNDTHCCTRKRLPTAAPTDPFSC